MRDHELRGYVDKIKEVSDRRHSFLVDKIATLEVILLDHACLLDTCTYCEKKVPKGQVWETGETYKIMPTMNDCHQACEECLKKFKEKCKAAKIGYKNKGKHE